MTDAPTASAVPPAEQPWEPTKPAEAAEILRGLEIRWYVAGGWALDLYLGRETRAHGDLDIAVMRGDEDAIRRVLRGWEVVIADAATLTPWAEGKPLPADRHAIWARPRGQKLWKLEVVVEQQEGSRWSYRRDARIGLHVKDVGRINNDGLRYLRPEVQLLYKSKNPRPVDESDLLAVLPRLDAYQRATLGAWITAGDPTHRWLERLK